MFIPTYAFIDFLLGYLHHTHFTTVSRFDWYSGVRKRLILRKHLFTRHATDTLLLSVVFIALSTEELFHNNRIYYYAILFLNAAAVRKSQISRVSKRLEESNQAKFKIKQTVLLFDKNISSSIWMVDGWLVLWYVVYLTTV